MDPSGAKQYQVTFDGGYSPPSQAGDGTIAALQDRRLVRLDRSGRQLDAPVDGIRTDPNGGEFYGPCEPKVSPDGRRIASTLRIAARELTKRERVTGSVKFRILR